MRAAQRVLAVCALLTIASAASPAWRDTLAAQSGSPVTDGDHGLDASAPPGAAGATTAGRMDSSELERQTSQVASGLRCPVCQGVSVEDSPTELARQMRAVVREQLAAGRTPDEVRAYFVDKYGEWILLEPKASGFNLVVYVLP